jgi:CheY-like chemotaxis protein
MSGPAEGSRAILIVDDQPFFISMARNILKSKGYTVHSALSGEEGILEARRTRPDLIILDVEMPGIDGIAACARMKRDPDLKTIPVVILTATLDPKLNERAFKAGAEATILKASSAQRILNMVTVVLSTERTPEAKGDAPPSPLRR